MMNSNLVFIISTFFLSHSMCIYAIDYKNEYELIPAGNCDYNGDSGNFVSYAQSTSLSACKIKCNDDKKCMTYAVKPKEFCVNYHVCKIKDKHKKGSQWGGSFFRRISKQRVVESTHTVKPEPKNVVSDAESKKEKAPEEKDNDSMKGTLKALDDENVQSLNQISPTSLKKNEISKIKAELEKSMEERMSRFENNVAEKVVRKLKEQEAAVNHKLKSYLPTQKVLSYVENKLRHQEARLKGDVSTETMHLRKKQSTFQHDTVKMIKTLEASDEKASGKIKVLESDIDNLEEDFSTVAKRWFNSSIKLKFDRLCHKIKAYALEHRKRMVYTPSYWCPSTRMEEDRKMESELRYERIKTGKICKDIENELLNVNSLAKDWLPHLTFNYNQQIAAFEDFQTSIEKVLKTPLRKKQKEKSKTELYRTTGKKIGSMLSWVGALSFIPVIGPSFTAISKLAPVISQGVKTIFNVGKVVDGIKDVVDNLRYDEKVDMVEMEELQRLYPMCSKPKIKATPRSVLMNALSLKSNVTALYKTAYVGKRTMTNDECMNVMRQESETGLLLDDYSKNTADSVCSKAYSSMEKLKSGVSFFKAVEKAYNHKKYATKAEKKKLMDCVQAEEAKKRNIQSLEQLIDFMKSELMRIYSSNKLYGHKFEHRLHDLTEDEKKFALLEEYVIIHEKMVKTTISRRQMYNMLMSMYLNMDMDSNTLKCETAHDVIYGGQDIWDRNIHGVVVHMSIDAVSIMPPAKHPEIPWVGHQNTRLIKLIQEIKNENSVIDNEFCIEPLTFEALFIDESKKRWIYGNSDVIYKEDENKNCHAPEEVSYSDNARFSWASKSKWVFEEKKFYQQVPKATTIVLPKIRCFSTYIKGCGMVCAKKKCEESGGKWIPSNDSYRYTCDLPRKCPIGFWHKTCKVSYSAKCPKSCAKRVCENFKGKWVSGLNHNNNPYMCRVRGNKCPAGYSGPLNKELYWVYAGTIGSYKYNTLKNAQKACESRGETLCPKAAIMDRNICNAGWTSDGGRGYPMASPGDGEGCGGPTPGWRSWDSGSVAAHCCRTKWLRPEIMMQLKEGTKIKAKWHDGVYYPGKILKCRNDGAYTVLFDDGDKRDGVPLDEVNLN